MDSDIKYLSTLGVWVLDPNKNVDMKRKDMSLDIDSNGNVYKLDQNGNLYIERGTGNVYIQNNNDLRMIQLSFNDEEHLLNFIKSLNKMIEVTFINREGENSFSIIKFIDHGKNSTFLVGNNEAIFTDLLSDNAKQFINEHNSYIYKLKSKNEAKNAVGKRYKIGDILVLRGKIKDGSERIVKKFEVKKVIWSIKSNPMNILILKQLEGPNNNRSLDKTDCKKYHIKYEPGLQVYSMMMNFSKIKRK